ncbi:MAG: prepilin peptidase [Microbacteriaceae bacterium]
MTSVDVLAWTIAFVVLVGILGSLIGSFLNVVVYRVPAGKSIVHPPSACPKCGAGIRPWDNIPVLSWLILRGTCRDCGNPIAVRYPLVELATAIVFAAIALWMSPMLGEAFAASTTPLIVAGILELAAFLYFAAIGIALLLIDLDTRKLPDVIVLPSYIVGIVLLGAVSLLRWDFGPLLVAGIGLVALWVFYFTLAVIKPGGMGFGDVKLSGVIGLYLGWVGVGSLIVGAFSAFLLGGVFSIVLVLARGAGRRTAIPFGPWMIAGAGVGVFFGETIANAYLALIGFN